MIRSITAIELKPGDKLALPFNRQAIIETVTIGTRFVNFTFNGNQKSRVEKSSEVLIEGKE